MAARIQPSADCVLAKYVSNMARPLSCLTPMKKHRLRQDAKPAQSLLTKGKFCPHPKFAFCEEKIKTLQDISKKQISVNKVVIILTELH